MLSIFGSNRKCGCRQIRERFSPYIDGRLDAVKRDEVKYHIQACGECHRELQSMEATVQLLRRMPVAVAPRSFTLAQAPSPQATRSFGVRVSDWANSAAAVITPSTDWLKAATAVAVIALMVMVTGDFTGTLHTNGTSDNPILKTAGSDSIIASVSEGTPTPAATLEAGTAQEAAEATQPAQLITVGDNQTDNEFPEVSPPLTSGNSFPPDRIEGPQLSGEALIEDGNAYSWLRPVEITLAFLAFVLGCGTLWRRQTRRSSAY